MVAGIAYLLIALTIAWQTFNREFATADKRLFGSVDRALAPASAKARLILVTGIDEHRGADGIMVLRVPGDGSRVSALSIPRDVLLEAVGGGERGTSVQHAEGTAALVRAVRQTTSLPIDAVVQVRLAGLRAAVDAVGGVTVDNPERLRTGPVAGRSAWSFPRGEVHLDRRSAEAFVRARSNEFDVDESDASRARRQQLVLEAVARRVPISTLRHPRRTPERLARFVGTSMEPGELWALFVDARGGVDVSCRVGGVERYLEAGSSVRGIDFTSQRSGRFVVAPATELRETVKMFVGSSSPEMLRRGRFPSGCERR